MNTTVELIGLVDAMQKSASAARLGASIIHESDFLKRLREGQQAPAQQAPTTQPAAPQQAPTTQPAAQQQAPAAQPAAPQQAPAAQPATPIVNPEALKKSPTERTIPPIFGPLYNPKADKALLDHLQRTLPKPTPMDMEKMRRDALLM